MNCMEFVREKLTEKSMKQVENNILTVNYIRYKQGIKPNSIIVFTIGLHIGFAKLWGCELETIECSDNEILRRQFSLHDDNIKVVLINPEFRKGSELEWQGV